MAKKKTNPLDEPIFQDVSKMVGPDLCGAGYVENGYLCYLKKYKDKDRKEMVEYLNCLLSNHYVVRVLGLSIIKQNFTLFRMLHSTLCFIILKCLLYSHAKLLYVNAMSKLNWKDLF